MSEIQACEGVWRQNCGRCVAVMSCEPREGGQRWADGVLYYADNGTVTFHEGGCAVDLVEYIGPFPQPDQSAEIERLRADWQREFTAAQQLRSKVAQLDLRLEEVQDELRELQEGREATERHCEGARSAFLAVIKTLAGVRS